MAKTNAERQQDYRKKRIDSGVKKDGEKRLDAWISTSSNLALNRLAFRYRVTKKEILEKLISEADVEIIKTLELDSPEWNAYYKTS